MFPTQLVERWLFVFRQREGFGYSAFGFGRRLRLRPWSRLRPCIRLRPRLRPKGDGDGLGAAMGGSRKPDLGWHECHDVTSCVTLLLNLYSKNAEPHAVQNDSAHMLSKSRLSLLVVCCFFDIFFDVYSRSRNNRARVTTFVVAWGPGRSVGGPGGGAPPGEPWRFPDFQAEGDAGLEEERMGGGESVAGESLDVSGALGGLRDLARAALGQLRTDLGAKDKGTVGKARALAAGAMRVASPTTPSRTPAAARAPCGPCPSARCSSGLTGRLSS